MRLVEDKTVPHSKHSSHATIVSIAHTLWATLPSIPTADDSSPLLLITTTNTRLVEDDVLVERQHVWDPPEGAALARRDVVQIAHALAEG